jgi:hypothetical protein
MNHRRYCDHIDESGLDGPLPVALYFPPLAGGIGEFVKGYRDVYVSA